MTTPTADPQPQLAGGSRTTGKASPALRIRRGLLIASPVLAALLAIVGSIADPAAGISGREMYEIYAEDPEAVQFKALALHWSYAFWIAPALLLVGLVRGRGAWLANIAGALAFAGLTTMPGLLFVDFYDSAIGQLNGADAAVAVSEHMDATMWAVPAFRSSWRGRLPPRPSTDCTRTVACRIGALVGCRGSFRCDRGVLDALLGRAVGRLDHPGLPRGIRRRDCPRHQPSHRPRVTTARLAPMTSCHRCRLRDPRILSGDVSTPTGFVPVLAPMRKVRRPLETPGTPNGIRTRATAVKGRRPRPLDDGGPIDRHSARPA